MRQGMNDPVDDKHKIASLVPYFSNAEVMHEELTRIRQLDELDKILSIAGLSTRFFAFFEL